MLFVAKNRHKIETSTEQSHKRMSDLNRQSKDRNADGRVNSDGDPTT